MKKIIAVITKVVDGTEVIDTIVTGTRFDRTAVQYYGKRITTKMIKKANDFIKNAKYRKNWNTESVFEFLNETGYKYSNAAL